MQAPFQCPTVFQAGLCSVVDAHTLQRCETEIRDLSGDLVSLFGTGEDPVSDSGSIEVCTNIILQNSPHPMPGHAQTPHLDTTKILLPEQSWLAVQNL